MLKVGTKNVTFLLPLHLTSNLLPRALVFYVCTSRVTILVQYCSYHTISWVLVSMDCTYSVGGGDGIFPFSCSILTAFPVPYAWIMPKLQDKMFKMLGLFAPLLRHSFVHLS